MPPMPAHPGRPDDAAPAVTRVVVQQRQRLFREGISQLLNAEVDVHVAAIATTDDDLLAACQEHRPGVVVLEAGITGWDPLRLVAAMRRAVPQLAVIGLTAVPPSSQDMATAFRGGVTAVISRDTGIGGILTALRTSTTPSTRDRLASGRPVPTPVSPPATLTGRELEVLSLVAAGLTSTAVANRLQYQSQDGREPQAADLRQARSPESGPRRLHGDSDRAHAT